jgi:integrase
LILLAPRKTALANMRWADIKDDVWITPFEFTKSKKTAKPRTYQTPLTPLAVRILAGLPRDGERVFVGVPMQPKSDLGQQLTRSGGPENFNYHCVRHTLATHMQNRGHSEFEIGLVLNHAGSGGVTGHYTHGHAMDLKRKLLGEWSDHVESVVTPTGAALLR